MVRVNDVTKRVVMGVTYVYLDPPVDGVRNAPYIPEPTGGIRYTVYTDDATYTIDSIDSNGLEIKNEVHHNFGAVTLVEYPCNSLYMGAFEVVLPLLDAINTTQSNPCNQRRRGKGRSEDI